MAIALLVILATQQAPRTWLAGSIPAAFVGLAIVSTVMNGNAQRRQRRWNAGKYD
jgi:hypothetical protein